MSTSPALHDLARNLRAGARLFFLRPVASGELVATLGQIVLLACVAGAVWTVCDWWGARPDPVFEPYGLPMVASVILASLLACVAVVLASAGRTQLTLLLTALAASLPFALPVLLLAHRAADALFDRSVAGTIVVAAISLVWGLRLLRIASAGSLWRASLAALLAVLAVVWSADRLYLEPYLWYPADSYEDDDWDDPPDYEAVLFDQMELIDEAASKLRAGVPGKVELYYVGFAGYGQQGVFARDVRFGAQALGRHYDLDGHVLELVNDDDDDSRRPLATVPGLSRALSDVASRMNRDEDILFLHLTSHGNEDPEVVVQTGSLVLQQLTPHALADALEASRIRYRVVMVSACYSGGFMSALDDRNTLVMTAASADRTSFGCSDDSELTYFGRAYFQDALPQSGDLIAAARKAIELVGQREQDEHLEPSHPQLFAGLAVVRQLDALVNKP